MTFSASLTVVVGNFLKVAKSNHVTIECCNHRKYETVAKHPDHDYMTKGVLGQPELQRLVINLTCFSAITTSNIC